MIKQVWACALIFALHTVSVLGDTPNSTTADSSNPPSGIEFIASHGSPAAIKSTKGHSVESTIAQDAAGAPRGGGGDPTGACCTGSTQCTIQTQAGCETEGFNWIGPDTTCDDCPLLPVCGPDSVFSQSPGDPFNFEGGFTSEAATGFRRFERFDNIVGPITRVTFYGFDLTPTPGGAFEECVESDNTFEISFHEDVGNRPGAVVCSYIMQATRTPTGVYYIAGFELNEYDAILPTPCLMARGWISIVGIGDPICWFLWSTPPEPVGDELSICLGCSQVVWSVDLAVCLRGTFGGVFGACCNTTTGACADNVEIFNCLQPNQKFSANTLCAELSPACGVVSGACCNAGAPGGVTCVDGVAEDDCIESGDRFEPDTLCQFLEPACGEAIGACCQGETTCVIIPQDDCLIEHLNWLGPDTTCDMCPPLPVCPTMTLFSQPPADPGLEPTAWTSEESRGARAWENFFGVSGPITSLRVVGFDLEPVGPTSFIECDELIPDFEVSFYEDEGGAPGDLISTYLVTATRTPTGVIYLDAEMIQFDMDLPEPVPLTSGWVAVVGRGTPTCYFLWTETVPGADGWVHEILGDKPRTIVTGGVALCLIGAPGGGVTGACCNQSTGACVNDVPMENCIGPNDRFAANATCFEAFGDCGVPKGACCLEQLECTFVSSADCASVGGLFLGVDMPCLRCPCKVFCAPFAAPENEPDCGSGFVDVTNYGCDQANPIFTPVDDTTPICGTTGSSFEGPSPIFDNDWFERVLVEAGELAYRIESEAPATLRVFDGTEGCPGLELHAMSVETCIPGSFSLFVGPGIYWIKIEPIGGGDTSACGGQYELTPLNIPCTGDLDFDRDIDMLDFTFMQSQFGMTGPGLFADLNGDEIIDIDDVFILEGNLGLICP